MEDGFRDDGCDTVRADVHDVLILVLVEDGFRAFSFSLFNPLATVLILVLVEDGFRGLAR